MAQTLRLLLALVFVLLAAGCGDPPARRPLTPDETEFLSLLEAQHAAGEAAREEAPERLPDGSLNWEAIRAWRADRPPLLPEDEALLAFEARHRGERVGLLAARVLMFGAGGTLESGNRHWRGRHLVLPALPAYAADPLLAEFIQDEHGGFDADIPVALATVRDAPDVTEGNRLAAELAIGRWHLGMAERREVLERALRDPSPDPEAAEFLPHLKRVFADLPDAATTAGFRELGLRQLEAVAASASTTRPPVMHPVRDRWPDWRVIDVHPDADPRPTFAEEAAGLLFAARSLQKEAPLPPLELPLLGGGTWSAEGHQGKVRLIHFGFRACGPCRRLTPTLRAIHDAHPDDVSLLAVRVDEDAADAKHARESGEIPWPIHHDRGRTLATAWAIRGYPTILVVGRDGRILDPDAPRGEELEALIARAVAEASAGTTE